MQQQISQFDHLVEFSAGPNRFAMNWHYLPSLQALPVHFLRLRDQGPQGLHQVTQLGVMLQTIYTENLYLWQCAHIRDHFCIGALGSKCQQLQQHRHIVQRLAVQLMIFRVERLLHMAVTITRAISYCCDALKLLLASGCEY